ncbi:MAG: hypothetical protein R3182_12920, partial [Draconibacterium sp.]|nr:hypothetical protein [Draconibacterium sp.]
MFRIKYIFLFILVITSVNVWAQRDTLTQEVEVTKAYQPTISDANKLNSMPVIDESEHQNPNFSYSIYSQHIFNTFSVNPLKAAIINTTKKEDTGYGMVRAGVGSYMKPYGEVFFNNLNNRNSVFGIHAKHLSSFGKINLNEDDRVDAPFMNNDLELFVKHMFQNSILSVDVNLDHDAFNYYGYPDKPEDPSDNVPAFLMEEGQKINYFGTKQSFIKGGFNIGLSNPLADYDEKAFGFNFDYHYFGTKTEQKEHYANFEANVKQPFSVGVGLLDLGALYTQADNIFLEVDSEIGKKAQTLLYAKPAWFFGNKTANIKLGINAWFIMETDKDTEAKLSPNIRANWAPVEEIINLYAGIDGNYISNYYSKIAYENPFVNPEHDVMNS